MKSRTAILLLVCLFVVTSALSTGCDSPTSAVADHGESLQKVAESMVQSVRVTLVADKSKNSGFFLTVTLKQNARNLRPPGAINILSQRKGFPNSLIYDNGQGLDQLAGDGIFTGRVPESCLPSDTSPRFSSENRAAKEPEISCKFDIVAPGEECGSYGECPETVHRSWLWGLIEYDTDIVFCFCLVECTLKR